MARVFVARKSCGCIVAAFPINMDKNIKAELLKQLTKAGYDVEQAGELDVQLNFALTCSHGKPPLLDLMDKAHEPETSTWDPAPLRDEMAAADSDAAVAETQAEEASHEEINNDGGVEMADVNALAAEGEEEPEETDDEEIIPDPTTGVF